LLFYIDVPRLAEIPRDLQAIYLTLNCFFCGETVHLQRKKRPQSPASVLRLFPNRGDRQEGAPEM
jgi:hypothetical protein